MRRCSFCGKAEGEVMHLIIGPGGIGVCDECVGLCNDILMADHPSWHATMLKSCVEHAASMRTELDETNEKLRSAERKLEGVGIIDTILAEPF